MWRYQLNNSNKTISLKTPIIFNFLAYNGWSYKDLASKIGVTGAYIGQLMRHKHTPSLAVIGKIAKAFNTQPCEIAEGIERPQEYNDNLSSEEIALLRFLAQHDDLSRVILKIAHKYEALT